MTDRVEGSAESLEAIAALQDPVRRRLYDYVAAQDHEVGRAEAADGAGIQRTLAAFHLDRLADAGLLDVVFRRPAGRGGPGAGRPAKLYRRSAADHAVSLPPRDYRAVAEVLAEVVEVLGGEEAAEAVARRRGRVIGGRTAGGGDEDAGEGVVTVLAGLGYEPYRDGAVIRLRNCPFHSLAEDFPPLVCGLNLALIEGILEGREEPGLTARLDPRRGGCCVALRQASKNKTH